jgi:hypothetical protein
VNSLFIQECCFVPPVSFSLVNHRNILYSEDHKSRNSFLCTSFYPSVTYSHLRPDILINLLLSTTLRFHSVPSCTLPSNSHIKVLYEYYSLLVYEAYILHISTVAIFKISRLPYMWRHNVLPKLSYLRTNLYDVIAQKTGMLTSTAAITSNLVVYIFR